MYPSAPTTDCPAAADALHDWLRGEDLRTVDFLSASAYQIRGTWRAAPNIAGIARVVRGMGPDNHVVVRGTRPASSAMALTHFFIMANIAGQVYVLDASTRDRTMDHQEYVSRQGFTELAFTRQYDATPNFEP
jgi:hypothetical protein